MPIVDEGSASEPTQSPTIPTNTVVRVDPNHPQPPPRDVSGGPISDPIEYIEFQQAYEQRQLESQQNTDIAPSESEEKKTILKSFNKKTDERGDEMRTGKYALTGKTKTVNGHVLIQDNTGVWVQADEKFNTRVVDLNNPKDPVYIDNDVDADNSYIDLGYAGNNNGILIMNRRGYMDLGVDVGNGTYAPKSDYDAALAEYNAMSTKGHMPAETIDLTGTKVKTIYAMYGQTSGPNIQLETAIIEPWDIISNERASNRTIPVMSPTGRQLGNIVFDLEDNTFKSYMYQIPGGSGLAGKVLNMDYNGLWNTNKSSISGPGKTDITGRPTVHEYTAGEVLGLGVLDPGIAGKLDLTGMGSQGSMKAGIGMGLSGAFTNFDPGKQLGDNGRPPLFRKIWWGDKQVYADDLSLTMSETGDTFNNILGGGAKTLEGFLGKGPVQSVIGGGLEFASQIPGGTLKMVGGGINAMEGIIQNPGGTSMALTQWGSSIERSRAISWSEDPVKTMTGDVLFEGMIAIGAGKKAGNPGISPIKPGILDKGMVADLLGTGIKDPMLTGVGKRSTLDRVTFEAIARYEIMKAPKEYRPQVSAAIDIMRISDQAKLRTNAEPSLKGLVNVNEEWTPTIKTVLGKDAPKGTRIYGGAAEASEIMNLPAALKENVNILDRQHHDIDVLTVAGGSEDLAKLFTEKINAKFPEANLKAEGGEVLNMEGKHLLDIHDVFAPDEGVSNLLPAPKFDQLYIPGMKGYKGGFRSEGLSYLTMRKGNAFVTNIKDLLGENQHRFETDTTDLLKDANILRENYRDTNPKLYNELTKNIEIIATKKYTYRTKEGVITKESGQAIFDRISKKMDSGPMRINIFRSPSKAGRSLSIGSVSSLGALSSFNSLTSKSYGINSKSSPKSSISKSLGINSKSSISKSLGIKSPSLGIKIPSPGIKTPSPRYKIPPPSKSIIPPPSRSIIPPPPTPRPTPMYGGLITGKNPGSKNPFKFGSSSRKWKNFGIMSSFVEGEKGGKSRKGRKRRSPFDF